MGSQQLGRSSRARGSAGAAERSWSPTRGRAIGSIVGVGGVIVAFGVGFVASSSSEGSLGATVPGLPWATAIGIGLVAALVITAPAIATLLGRPTVSVDREGLAVRRLFELRFHRWSWDAIVAIRRPALRRRSWYQVFGDGTAMVVYLRDGRQVMLDSTLFADELVYVAVDLEEWLRVAGVDVVFADWTDEQD